MPNVLSITNSSFSEKIVQVDAANLRHIPKELNYIHACKDSYILSGDSEHIANFTQSRYCANHTPCHFPRDIWKIEYKYLGDYSIQQPVRFNLKLHDDLGSHTYHCKSNLPAGLKFENGILSGVAQEKTEILHLHILAQGPLAEHSTKYMIRFFEQSNQAKSFLHNNYLKIGYGKNMVDYAPDEIYFRTFIQKDFTVGTPLEEATLAAKKIFQAAAGQEIYLFISGGIDSQIMVQSFIKAQVPFTAVLMVDVHGCNEDDVYFARLFMNKLKLKIHEYEFDFLDFIQNYKYLELARTYRFNNPEYGVLLQLMEKFKGFGVYAGRPISISSAPDGNQVLGLAVDETWSRARYLERTERQGCPEFAIYTQELVQSFLNTEYARQFRKEMDWTYDSKLALLKDGGFDIDLAPPIKYTGFEKLYKFFKETSFGNEIWLQHRAPLKLRFPNPKLRNAMKIESGLVIDSQLITKPYEDGFSYKYILKNPISKFH